MKSVKFIPSAVFAAIISLTILSCSKSDPYTPLAGDDSHKVSIRAGQFDPAVLNMLPSTKVVWTNTDTDVHSVVSDDGTSFNSGNISAGGTFNFTPTVTGTIGYHCGVHPGVQGTLNVVTR